MKIRVRAAIWLILLGALSLTGCGEVLNEYYVSNHTDTAVAIAMTPYEVRRVDIFAGPLIENLESSARETLEQTLAYEVQEDVIRLTLPPNTTVYLGSSGGGEDLFSQFEVSFDGQQITMDADNYHDYFELHDKFVGAIVHVYNITE